MSHDPSEATDIYLKLKDVETLLCSKLGSIVDAYVPRNTTNKLLLPVRLFDSGLRRFELYPAGEKRFPGKI